MAINYAEKWLSQLDSAVKQGTLTNALVPKGVKWIGAKTFHIPSISTSGYKQYSRSNGFSQGTYDVDTQPFTITQDRGVEFLVDVMDIDETNLAGSVANITGEFTTEQAYPEIDAYRFSKLYELTENKTSTGITGTPEDVYKALKADLNKVRKYGTSTIECYVSTDVMSAIESYRGDRLVVVINNKDTTIETRVTVIDGVKITEVFDADRFWSEYDFTEGFEPDVGAVELNWVIASTKSAVAAVKHSVIKLFSPKENQKGDGYLYQNRIYHDILIKEKNKDGVIVNAGGVTFS